MENNSFSIFNFQEDDADASASCPDFTVSWDVGMNPISYPGFSQSSQGLGIAYNKNNNNNNSSKGKQPKQYQEVSEGGTSNQEVQKKKMHRDIERQRRHEMSTLYASLRSVLPPQFLKGKRSICDQLDVAKKYIGCVQDNIRELGIKRDNINIMSRADLQESSPGGFSSQTRPVFVKVQPCCVGVEVFLRCDSMPEGFSFPISKILKVLLEEGLGPVSCNSTRCDESLNYVIQSEVLDNSGVDLQVLQAKLNVMVTNLIDKNV
ncbi:basic helix-loop-helix (bHLH) DNA-bindingsuperfamily protein [Striga asiatica]|uniref:Basic helix-loop-helix (BHLH) DNA-bindingsuperfamily protein n=1 Tax=Striga asiatica TaxID=4170 RepID=A0A5A7PQF3_STRAF|nr:basic helix-loop-helix (bHLH) DNA-bindingsuperfamily protein [Striga asiatica]